METNKPKFFIIDEATNQAPELKICSGSFVPEFENAIAEPVSVNNSYKFECNIKGLSLTSEIKELLDNAPGYQTACQLTNKLNDLIEEYHAPGTPRRERRAIKREFNKVFKMFRRHCYAYGIGFQFERPDN